MQACNSLMDVGRLMSPVDRSAGGCLSYTGFSCRGLILSKLLELRLTDSVTALPTFCIPEPHTHAHILCMNGMLNPLSNTATLLLQLHQHRQGENRSRSQPVLCLQLKGGPCRNGQARKACPMTYPASAGMMKHASGCWISSMSQPRKANSRWAG